MTRFPLRNPAVRRAIIAFTGLAVLAACGSPSPAADDVASLDTVATAAPADDTGGSGDTDGTDGTGESTPTSVDPEDAFTDYTQCMRDEGVDLPDPQVISAAPGAGSGGQVQTIDINDGDGAEGGPVVDFASDEVQAAEEICRPILDNAFGEIELDPEVLAEQREQMLDFAKCIRERRIDFPDPTFGDNGSMSVQVGGPGDEDEPADFDSEEWQQASEACGEFMGGGFVGAPIAVASDNGEGDD